MEEIQNIRNILNITIYLKNNFMYKKVIWDLMGGGCNSLRKALKAKHILNKYNVYTFDIVKKSNGFKNIILDLSKPYIYIYR